MTSAEQKKFEQALSSTREHTNKQTFGANAEDVIYETIDTPGVDLAGKIGCLITACAVYIDCGSAGNAGLLNGQVYRGQLLAGTQTGYLNPDSNKFLCEKQLYMAYVAAGVTPIIEFPIMMVNPTRPVLVVDPKMTIVHQAAAAPDFDSENIFTVFSYVNVELSLEMHTSRLHAQMNLT